MSRGCPLAKLPVSVFTDDPELGLISISPSGDYLARSKRDGEYGTFQVVTYPEREVKINYGLGRHTEVGGMTWFDDDRLLITGVRFVPVSGPPRVPTGELHVVEVESGKMDLLVRGGALMHQLPDEPDHVLILRYNNRFAEAHRMNVKNGHLRRIARSATRGGNLLANAEGRLEFSMGTNDEFVQRGPPPSEGGRLARARHIALRRRGVDSRWYSVLSPELWYTLDSRDASTTGFGVYNTDDLTSDMVIRHPTVDISERVDRQRQQALGGPLRPPFPGLPIPEPGAPVGPAACGTRQDVSRRHGGHHQFDA